VCPEGPPLANATAVLVLQHPQEQDKLLGTAGIVARRLARARVAVGLSWRGLAQAWGDAVEPATWGVLYLGSVRAPAGAGPPVALSRGGTPLADQGGAREGLQGLVALDGSWSQAKALWWRNPWLSRLRRFALVPAAPSLYGELRREARDDAVSTLEAVAMALVELERDPALGEGLMAPFRDLLARARAQGLRHGAGPGPNRRPNVRRRDRRSRL